MAWKTFVKEYLILTKKDRLATLAIIFILAAMFSLPRFFSKSPTTLTLQEDSLLINALDTLQRNSRQNPDENEITTPLPYNTTPQQSKGYNEGKLFHFDPNTLPMDGWKRLGLNDRTIRILINYRNKGGKFYKPEDLKKVWTMPEGFYEKVKAHIIIPPVEKPVSYPAFAKPTYNREERKLQPVDINQGDTTAFIALPGIGPVLAGRIIKFRDRLGGFHSVDQIGETYGLPDSTFQKLKSYFTVNPQGIRKLNINQATKDDLKAHPYIRWALANAIVEYRNQHGSYQSIEDLKNIAILDEATFEKIKNYLSLE